ncbi:hypothetical protein [Paenibacillus xerothermodurans]|uniref:Uncharacterized protein n=1 Tax=Paenibacillus xerothermodurans TaxID=1977292 RepID=A0A2W1NX25_PAEXE|nr:hypothetical protein [Paenibacillus xerothermodurans]PZE20212.1 hypothetical protein CBW46_013755 [Paenibacillus xerothermodurans]
MPPENEELRDLKTHVMGGTNMHETRTTDHVVQIQPQLDPTMGPHDMREDRYDLQTADTNKES